MKQNKKLLVLSLSLLLGLGMTACGNNNNNSSTSEPAKDSSSSVIDTSSNEQTSSSVEEVSSSVEEVSSSIEESSDNTDEEYNTLANDVADSIRLANKDNKKRLESFTLPTVQSTYNKKDEKVNFTVTWTLNVEEGGFENAVSLGQLDDKGMQVVNVSYTEANNVQTNFTLVGTVSDGNGHTATVTLDGYYVPEYVVKYTTLAEFREMADSSSKEDATVLGYVSAIYKSGIYVTNDNNETFYCYSPAGVTNYAEEFPIGTKVIATGTATTYYSAYQFNKGCTLKKMADKVDYTITYTDQTEVFTNAKSPKDSDALTTLLNSYVELKNVKINDIDAANYYYYFTLGTNKYYFRTTTSFINPKTGKNFTTAEASSIVAEWTEGYTANIKGLVQSYSGSFYITPIEEGSVTIVSKDIDDSAKMANDINAVKNAFASSYAKASEVTLPSEGETYKSALTYEVTAGNTAKIENGKVIITPAAVEETVTIKVTATLNNKSVDDEITFTVLATQDLSKQVELTVDTLGIGSYPDGETTTKIGNFEFAYANVGNYGNGLQFKKGTTDETGAITPVSYLRTTNGFEKGIASITVNLNEGKMTHKNDNNFLFEFGSTNEYKDYSYSLNVTGSDFTYTITPDVKTYKFFKITNMIGFASYIDSIVVSFEDGGSTPVTPDEFTTDYIIENKALPSNLSYITNNDNYPDPAFYSNGGLKLNFEGQGVITNKFAAQKSLKVTLKVLALNSNTKTAKSTDVFTVYALNDKGETVATAALQSVIAGDNEVSVTGEGIVQIKVIMTGYPKVNDVYNNISFGGLTLDNK